MPRRIMMVSTHGYVAADPELGHPDTGGQVVYVLELSRSLARMGFEVDILTRQFAGRAAQERVAPGVRLLRFPCGGDQFIPKEFLADYLQEWCRAVLASSEIDSAPYEFINTHYWDAGVAGEILSAELGIPHLHTPHSLGVLKRDNEAWGQGGATAADNLTHRIQRERILYHRSHRIIATTAEQRLCLAESDDYNVAEQKIDQIPPGYNDQLFFPVAEGNRLLLKQQIGLDVPLIFAAGRAAPNKGYDLLVSAMPAVLKRVPDARLMLAIGSSCPSPGEQQLLAGLHRQAAELGVLSRVSVTNCVAQRSLADLYRAADVFVLCSRYEAFGMTAIEAMACGTPTVVTTRGGLWEELNWGTDAIYCDPCDSDALAHSICSILLHSGIRRQLKRTGAETVASRYTWKHVASQLWTAHAHLAGCQNRDSLVYAEDWPQGVG